MITISQGTVKTCTGVSRRDFLRIGGVSLGSLGLGLAELNVDAYGSSQADRAVILLMLVGGPSQLETWDPKPDAPSEMRPFRLDCHPHPRVRICEHLPRLAMRMDESPLCVRCTTTQPRSMRPDTSFCKPGGFAGRARSIRTSAPWRRDCSRPGAPCLRS